MPSTRRQKAKERRSRQLDIMSDVENVDIMLGSYSRCDEENNISENEGNLDSGSSRPQQSSNVIGEDFRSLLNTNSRENSEITIETTRLISEEISNQMSRKFNEVKTNLSSQVQEAITAAITNTVLPAIQNTLETQGRLDFTMVDRGSNGPHLSPRPTDFTIRDRRSSGLQRNAEVGNAQKSWENCPRTCFTQENTRLRSRESSTDSNNSEQIHDRYDLGIMYYQSKILIGILPRVPWLPRCITNLARSCQDSQDASKRVNPGCYGVVFLKRCCVSLREPLVARMVGSIDAFGHVNGRLKPLCCTHYSGRLPFCHCRIDFCFG